MTITPLAFVSTTDGTDLVVDADLKTQHPRIVADLWPEHTTYRPQLVAAFDNILVDLVAREYLAARIPDSAANRAWMKRAVIERAFAAIFLDFITAEGDRWSLMHVEHAGQYARMLAAVSLEYDRDDDGSTDTKPKAEPPRMCR